MNNAKMWLVVPPAVGVPIFLGAVAVGSFSVHVAVLSNTSWVSDFLSGQELGTGDEMAAAKLRAEEMELSKAAFVLPQPEGAQEVLIILPDGSTAKAVLQTDGLVKTAAPPLVDTH